MAADKKSKKNSHKKGQKKKKEEEGNDEVVEGDFDERFIAAVNRPQFKSNKDEKSKVVLDDRFASVLTDPKFSLQTKDKYGRKTKKKKAEAGLSEFYTVEKGEDSNDDDAEGETEKELPAINNDDDSEDDDKDKDPASRIAYLTALSRGEVDVSESSDNDSDSDESDDNDSDSGDDAEQGKAGILDPSNKEEDEVSITDVPSPYMAVMNMDWSHVRAVDLFSMIASFTPPGSVRKVQIFPSDYGLERMAKEKHEGPSGLWKKQKNPQSESEEEDEVESDEEEEQQPRLKFELEGDVNSGFDQEKLRAYEASKLKYYFAIVEFTSPEHADVAYNEVDGLELEHSSASVDMRSIDPDQLEGVVNDRKLRDEATSVPSNYEPPEFVVNALQQTNVECTWDEGDAERTRKLTQYSAAEGWQDLADSGDLRAYLASDNSSGDDSDEESEEGGKTNKMRMLLGLDGDDDELEMNKSADQSESDESDDDDFGAEEGEKQATFIPGKKTLEDKIRNKIQSKGEKELTPWEKYQEKRKQKRRERRQIARKGGKPDEESDEEDEADFEQGDDFFVDEERDAMKMENKIMKKKAQKNKKKDSTVAGTNGDRAPSTKAELSLLVAGEGEEEDAKDYDMRGLIRMDKLKDKKLKGARKRKQAKLAANVSGGGFKINTQDNRFAAVLKGADDRYGIDRTDPNFKDTPAMRDILSEQTKERKRKRAKKGPAIPNINAEAAGSSSSGAMALSSLVQSLKSKVAENTK